MNHARDRIFLGYSFSTPGIEAAVRKAAGAQIDVIVAKDEILGSHILDKILSQMTESTLCLFDLTGHNVNVALELGLAMGAQTPYRLLYCPGAAANPHGSRDFFSDLKGWDHLSYDSFEELATKLSDALPRMLEHAKSRHTSPLAVVAARGDDDPYSQYVRDGFSAIARVFQVPTYVCRFDLTVHPTRFIRERLPLDDLASLFDGIMVNSRSGRFPIASPLDSETLHLRDGIQVDVDFVGASSRRYRECYRFLENGSFLFEHVLSSDIDSSGGYVTGDKTIGYLELISLVTQMGALSSSLARLYAEFTIARVKISGLAHHRLVDDTGCNVLKAYGPPIEDEIDDDWLGTPEDFQQNVQTWTRAFIKKTLRLLNAPRIGLDAIEGWQRDYK